MRCPACAYENPRDALVCGMCKRVLRREGDPLPEPDVPELPHHAIDLPGDRPAARPLELAERPRQPSSRPPPPADSPGTNPTSARTISYRPPPIAAPAREPGALERTLGWAARPFDALVRLATRPTIGSVALQPSGVLVAVLPFFVSRGTGDVGAWGITILCLGIAIGARAWAVRGGGEDASAPARVAVTLFPYVAIVGPVVAGIGALVGGFDRADPASPIEVSASGRALLAGAALAYLVLAGVAIARDRARSGAG